MKCTACNKKIKPTAEKCKYCGEVNVKRVYKTNKLGNCAVIFAFVFSIVGLVLGILSIVFGALHNDKTLLTDGIVAVVMSLVVTTVWILFYVMLISLGVALPFMLPLISA